MTVKASLAFASYTDLELDSFTESVITRMTDNAHFPTPPVPLTGLQEAADTFQAALAAMPNGGKQATAFKNQVRAALLGLLRQQAIYVQVASADNLPVLLSSGFEATKTNRGQSPLATPTILEIRNEVSTELVVRATPLANAKTYEAQVKVGAGEWKTAALGTRARRLVLQNLVPGTLYSVQVRGIGGSTGFSAWSDPVTHMAT